VPPIESTHGFRILSSPVHPSRPPTNPALRRVLSAPSVSSAANPLPLPVYGLKSTVYGLGPDAVFGSRNRLMGNRPRWRLHRHRGFLLVPRPGRRGQEAGGLGVAGSQTSLEGDGTLVAYLPDNVAIEMAPKLHHLPVGDLPEHSLPG